MLHCDKPPPPSPLYKLTSIMWWGYCRYSGFGRKRVVAECCGGGGVRSQAYLGRGRLAERAGCSVVYVVVIILAPYTDNSIKLIKTAVQNVVIF